MADIDVDRIRAVLGVGGYTRADVRELCDEVDRLRARLAECTCGASDA